MMILGIRRPTQSLEELSACWSALGGLGSNAKKDGEFKLLPEPESFYDASRFDSIVRKEAPKADRHYSLSDLLRHRITYVVNDVAGSKVIDIGHCNGWLTFGYFWDPKNSINRDVTAKIRDQWRQYLASKGDPFATP